MQDQIVGSILRLLGLFHFMRPDLALIRLMVQVVCMIKVEDGMAVQPLVVQQLEPKRVGAMVKHTHGINRLHQLRVTVLYRILTQRI